MQQLGRISKHAEQKQAGHKKQLATMMLFILNSRIGEVSQAVVPETRSVASSGNGGIDWEGA